MPAGGNLFITMSKSFNKIYEIRVFDLFKLHHILGRSLIYQAYQIYDFGAYLSFQVKETSMKGFT